MELDISWTEIKDCYTAKKAKWALTKSYYSGYPIWAECQSHEHSDGKYGYKLLEPYTEDEVALYERKMGFKLPADLRHYLVNVSRELFSSSYPIVFRLLRDEAKEYEDNDPRLDIGTFQLPAGTQLWDYGGCVKHGSTTCSKLSEPWDGKMDNCTEECSLDSNEPCGGMLTVSDGGCTDQSSIVVKGNEMGTIWDNGNGGDTLYRSSHKNFYDLITDPIRRDRRMKSAVRMF